MVDYCRRKVEAGQVSGHKFKIGQTVTYTSGSFGRGGVSGTYKVMQLLPAEGGDFQYRIKESDLDPVA